ncbi:MAG: hypothetical protein WBW04_06170 [Nitrolancea sp.]
MAEMTAFEPKNYLTRISGADYLEVKWRLVWFRNENPTGRIQTELVSHENETAVFRATVEVPDGGSATGWGSEEADDFGDYIEKAETKALGRALAALGYGTQFCPDFEFGASDSRVVDSPIDLNRTRSRRGKSNPEQMPATERQVKFLFAIAREVGLSDDELNEESQEMFGQAVDKLRRRDASTLIERLQQRREAAHAVS